MPSDKICPFQLFFKAKLDTFCKQSECALWSISTNMCSYTSGIDIISDISESLKTLIDIVSIRLPEK